MSKIKTVQQAFDLDGLDAKNVEITGIPARHLEAVKAFAKLCVVHDAVNPEFQPDYIDLSQIKYENWFKMGSRSGVGFSYDDYGYRVTFSGVGARLVSESSDKSKHIAENFNDLYKAMMVYVRKPK